MMIFVLKKSLRERKNHLAEEQVNVIYVTTIRLNMGAGTLGRTAAFSMNVLFVKVLPMVLGTVGLRSTIEVKEASIPEDMERAPTVDLTEEKLILFIPATEIKI